ncbi:hypothetical protein [Streptomyces sp. HD]|uniref:hypothetical protein n=1 Tax=Streptomyces sp. HD TaxID=3020892 RepID=UPI00232C8CA0|nr:hypothetical protein [Streptomyces sp. HD]MDC0771484.1 hypothetical protein [Streptomyces sp. HD]
MVVTAVVIEGAGCGLRRGEVFGLADDKIGDLGRLYMRRQVGRQNLVLTDGRALADLI